MMHDYRMSLDHVVRVQPLATGMALAMAMRERRGIDDGNNYADQQVRRAMKTMGRLLSEHYEIIP